MTVGANSFAQKLLPFYFHNSFTSNSHWTHSLGNKVYTLITKGEIVMTPTYAKINISNLRLRTYIGFNPEEKEKKLSEHQLSIFGIVRRLREQRWGMVHTSVQDLDISFI